MRRSSHTPRAKDTLSRVNVVPRKERGQNFLIDESIIEQLILFGNPKPDEKIVEIGPGLGALTRRLMQVAPVTAIEIEKRFCDELQLQLPGLELINRDVREVNFSDLGERLIVFGNLPYSFSTDITFHLISFYKEISRAVLMLQREFAERIAAPPGGREYGILSIMVQLFADVRLGIIIPGSAFHPPTKVESRLLELNFLPAPRYEVADMEFFRRVVKAAFAQRRKKLTNSLKGSGFFTGTRIDDALRACSIDGGRRAETLTIEEYVRLAESLSA